MRALPMCLVVAVCAALTAGNASAVTYQLDDGTTTISVGLSAGGVLWWANDFVTVAGGEKITDIQISFGRPETAGSNNLAIGDPFVVALYQGVGSDPRSGLTLLTSSSATVASNVVDVFQTVDIADQVVSGHFYVAAVMDHGLYEYPASYDDTTPQGRSWVAGLDGLTTEAMNDPAGHALPFAEMNTIDSYGYPSNWMLRAVGEPNEVVAGPVPEPLTLFGVLCGLGAVGAKLRRRVRGA